MNHQRQKNPRLTKDHHSSPAWSERLSDSALLAKVNNRLFATSGERRVASTECYATRFIEHLHCLTTRFVHQNQEE